MYLIYIDESGKPSMNHSSPIYVQAAFMIQDSDWEDVDNAVNKIKLKWFPTLCPEDIEFHAYDMVHGMRAFKTIPRNDSLLILEEICDLIGQSDCILVASVIHKKRFRKKMSRDEIELWAHRLLFERVCKYLDKHNQECIENGMPVQRGILFIDSINRKYDNQVRNKYNDLFTNGTFFSDNEFLIETPLFVNSQYRNMSQLVDTVAYLVHRMTILGKKTNSIPHPIDLKLQGAYNSILSCFDTGPFGKLEGCGIKHFPS